VYVLLRTAAPRQGRRRRHRVRRTLPVPAHPGPVVAHGVVL